MIDLDAIRERRSHDQFDGCHREDAGILLAYVDELLETQRKFGTMMHAQMEKYDALLKDQYDTSSLLADYRHAAGEQGATIIGLRAELTALREAAGKVTCRACDNKGELWFAASRVHAPCPDCADLRRLLNDQPRDP